MGTFTADFQHHQVGAEEEPSGSAGCVGVLQLQEDLQQPEVHEFHRYVLIVSYGCIVQLSISHYRWGFLPLINKYICLIKEDVSEWLLKHPSSFNTLFR